MRVLLASAALLSLISAPMAATYAAPSIAPRMGGWQQANVDPQARKAAQFALPRLKRGKARIRKIDGVERQIVAGTNYRIAMTLTDGSRWRVTVWQKLDRTYRLTSSERIKAVAAAAQLTVTGRIAYRERMALPAGSIVKISIDDISRADAPSRPIAAQRIVTKGEQVPIPFSIKLDRTRLPGPIGNTLSVRIESPNGQLLWINDTINSIEPDERTNIVDMETLMLVRATG